jgi:hypothetical protein
MLTLGEKRVRVDFNTIGSQEIDNTKKAVAKLINEVEAIEYLKADIGEFKRLQALAMTAYEEAAMWHVKALTL